MLITGNTYPVKEQLKAIGGRWNQRARGWDVPADKADQARAIVSGAGNTRRAAPRARYSNFGDYDGSGGREYFENARGRCEDAPCCGCCS